MRSRHSIGRRKAADWGTSPRGQARSFTKVRTTAGKTVEEVSAFHHRIAAVTTMDLRETTESASRRSLQNLIRALAGIAILLGCSIAPALASPIAQDVVETDLATSASVASGTVVGELWSLLLLGTGLAIAAAILRRRARTKLRSPLMRRPA
jgi:hypothetical protein